MKKIMMTLAAVAVAVSVNAQVYLGGSLGFTSSKDDTEGAKATTRFAIKPEVGYNLDENWAVGMGIGFASTKAGDADAASDRIAVTKQMADSLLAANKKAAEDTSWLKDELYRYSIIRTSGCLIISVR